MSIDDLSDQREKKSKEKKPEEDEEVPLFDEKDIIKGAGPPDASINHDHYIYGN